MAHTCALSIIKPVLCVGSTVIDYVTIIRKFPDVDRRERCIKSFWQRGGHASNICTVIRILGAPVEFFGVLSRSLAYSVMIEDLRRRGICIENCPKTDDDPPFSTVMLTSDTGLRSIITCNKNFPYVTPEQFRNLDLSRYGWIHFEANDSRQTIAMIRQVLAYNSGRIIDDRIIISLEVDRDYEKNLDLFDMCNYVIFSRQLSEILGWKTPYEACHHLDKAIPIPRSIHINRPCYICPWNVIGAGCIDSDGNYSEMPAYKPKKMVDTLGAGDCFSAAFIYSIYVRKRNLRDAVDFSNMVAGHKIGSFGYDNIANFKLYPKKEIIDDDTESKAECPEEDNFTNEQRVCAKYLNREIQKTNTLFMMMRDDAASSSYSLDSEISDVTIILSDLEKQRIRRETKESGSLSTIRYVGNAGQNTDEY